MKKSYRVSKICADFDIKEEHSHEHFVGEIKMPEDWQIGVICGHSGTGKTTIAKELFDEKIINGFEYDKNSVLDNMPEELSCEDISKMFYSVGFGSVPSWLKPYHVLSNGEKMRVDLARAIMQEDFIVFDEFTSVVDRAVAQTASIAVSKAIQRTDKKFIAVTCHEDVIEWLEPDWVFDTNKMQCFFGTSPAQVKTSKSEDVAGLNGDCLANIII